MNIFASNWSPRLAARALDNKRVVKMVLESAQMLSTALVSRQCDFAPYQAAFTQHPCTIWTTTNRQNYLWLLQHFLYLCLEYTHRYHRIHKCQQLYPAFKRGVSALPPGQLTTFADCSGNRVKQFLHTPNILTTFEPEWQRRLSPYCQHPLSIPEKYQLCLLLKWHQDIRPVNWSQRTPPDFYGL